MANSTVGTIFYVYAGTTAAATADQVYGMVTKPALPGRPNLVDATSQEDKVQKNVRGTIQLPEANFQFKYHKHSETLSNFDFFSAIEEADEFRRFGVLYPDGGAIEFIAKIWLERDGTGVNALDTFTVQMLEIKGVDKNATKPVTVVMNAYAEAEAD